MSAVAIAPEEESAPVVLDAAERAACRAALAAAFLSLDIPAVLWAGHEDGTAAVAVLGLDGRRAGYLRNDSAAADFTEQLLAGTHRMTAHLTCPGGGVHEYSIGGPADVDAARQDVADCTTDHAAAAQEQERRQRISAEDTQQIPTVLIPVTATPARFQPDQLAGDTPSETPV